MADLLGELPADDPMGFLAMAASLVSAVDPRTAGPFAPRRAAFTLPDMVGLLAGVEGAEAAALLAAITVLAPDEHCRASARRAVAGRPDQLPAWLAGLARARVERAVQTVDVLGDGDDIILDARLPGFDLAMVVYIDHNLATVAKDGFPAPVSFDELLRQLRQGARRPGHPALTFTDIPLADARARITEAIDRGAMIVPPLETDTWPDSRPLAEWLARLLPEGGTGYVRPQWSEAELRELADRFFGSRFGRGLDDSDHRELLEQFLWFGTDYGPGDPLRWSPVAVDILLADWIPRKIIADPQFLAPAPELLRAFIRFCHDERGISPALTRETLAAVDENEPAFQLALRPDRRDPRGMLAAARGDPFSAFHRRMLASLAEEAGGEDALDALDDAPLPEENFAWDGVPAGVHDLVQAALGHCDRCADELLGPEYRTACRRLLARAAPEMRATPLILARPEVVAEAVCWVICRVNHRFGTRPGELRVKDMTAFFGLGRSAPSQRRCCRRPGSRTRTPIRSAGWECPGCWCPSAGARSSSCVTGIARFLAADSRTQDGNRTPGAAGPTAGRAGPGDPSPPRSGPERR